MNHSVADQGFLSGGVPAAIKAGLKRDRLRVITSMKQSAYTLKHQICLKKLSTP